MTLQANPEIFFEDGNEATAKAFCHGCPVMQTCWEWAMENDEYGVWGGTSRVDRNAVERGGTRATCPACRSESVYEDHAGQLCVACGKTWR